jgi:hypothetical protein
MKLVKERWKFKTFDSGEASFAPGWYEVITSPDLKNLGIRIPRPRSKIDGGDKKQPRIVARCGYRVAYFDSINCESIEEAIGFCKMLEANPETDAAIVLGNKPVSPIAKAEYLKLVETFRAHQDRKLADSILTPSGLSVYKACPVKFQPRGSL